MIFLFNSLETSLFAHKMASSLIPSCGFLPLLLEAWRPRGGDCWGSCLGMYPCGHHLRHFQCSSLSGFLFWKYLNCRRFEKQWNAPLYLSSSRSSLPQPPATCVYSSPFSLRRCIPIFSCWAISKWQGEPSGGSLPFLGIRKDSYMTNLLSDWTVITSIFRCPQGFQNAVSSCFV